MDATKFRRPRDTKPRRPEGLIRGRPYKVDTFCREKSQFLAKDGSEVHKLIAIYQDIGMKFHTFLPIEYDNKDDAWMTEINEAIVNGEDIRIVFYGKISVSNELKILRNGENVDKEKLEGIAVIEASEKGTEKRGCDHCCSPAKMPKLE